MAKKVVVIRVGSKTTHIVHMENIANNPTVYGCVRVPTPEGAVADGIVMDVPEIARRIKKACQEKGIRTKEAIFTISSSKIASRETVIPAVQKAKQQQVVMAKVPDLFPVDTDRYIFSYQIQGKEREDENEEGKVLDVRVFAAPSELVETYYTLASTAGLEIQAIEADGNSVFQIMRRQVAKDGVNMAVQINRQTTLVNVIAGDVLLLQRVIPYGVNSFAEVMMQEEVFQATDYDRAYQILTSQRVLVKNLGAENPNNDFSLGKRIEVTDGGEFLISNIGRVIEYYNSKYRDQPIQKILLIGRGSSMAGIHELLANELGIPVATPTELNGIRFNRKVRIDAAILQYLSCFGSVYAPVKFVPQEVARREAAKGSLTGSVLIFVGLMLLSAVLVGVSFLQLSMATNERDTMRSRHNALASVESEHQQLTELTHNYELTGQLKQYTDTNNNHFPKLLTDISAVVPRTFRIQSIQSDESTVTISGVSKDRLSSLSVLQMQLNKLDRIMGVTINQISKSSDEMSGRRQYSYTLTFQYVPKVIASDETAGNSDSAEGGSDASSGTE